MSKSTVKTGRILPALGPQGAVAPVSPAPSTGTKSISGHWRLCKALYANNPFVDGVTLSLSTTHNPWRSGCAGHQLHNLVLQPLQAKHPKGFTMSQVVDLAAKVLPKLKASGLSGIPGHLCYLYTFGCYMQLNGKFHSAFTAVTPKVVAAAQAQ